MRDILASMISERLEGQMRFIFELEKLKVVYRQNGTVGGERRENSAEHSWHISVMAFLLAEYCPEPVDIQRVLKMLLLHDVVEIYAGDTFLYDRQGREDAKAVEAKAAARVFALLPDDQGEEFIALWEEFERRDTAESRYAAVLDNLQPILNHYFTNNQNIAGKGLFRSQIVEKKGFIAEFSEELWEFAVKIIDESVKLGLYRADGS